MLTVFVRSMLIYAILTVILRVMGKRQIGELEITELVAALLLSELAAMVIDDSEKPFLFGVIPIVCILLLEIIISFGVTKVNAFKKMLESSPSTLIRQGIPDEEELLKMRITLEELLGELRLKGVGCIDTVAYAILEQNGQLSVILKEEKKSEGARGIDHPLVIDGVLNKCACNMSGYDRSSVEKELQKRNCQLKDVFLLAVDDLGKITLIRKKRGNRK